MCRARMVCDVWCELCDVWCGSQTAREREGDSRGALCQQISFPRMNSFNALLMKFMVSTGVGGKGAARWHNGRDLAAHPVRGPL